MFFWRGFQNLKLLRKTKISTTDIAVRLGSDSSLVGFVVGALFAPETYQFFPYFAVAFTADFVADNEMKRARQGPGPTPPPPKSRVISWRFMPIARTEHGAVSPVR